MRTGAALLVFALLTIALEAGERDPAAKIAQAKKELEPRPLTLPLRPITAAEFLAQLEKQTGNVVLNRRFGKHDQLLTLAFDKTPFWQALDTFTARAGFPLEHTRRFIEGPNDGFVPLLDAQIPGARLVVLDGVDHAALALPWLRPFRRYEPGRVAQALIAIALE